MIEYGADLNTAGCPTNSYGTKLLKSEFPIRVAVTNNSKDVVELLLQHGAKANILYFNRDQGYETLFHTALTIRKNIAHLSLEHGVDDGSKSQDNLSKKSAFSFEEQQRQLSQNVLQVLLRYGANPQAMNNWKEDPLLCFYKSSSNHGINCAYIRNLLWTAAADNVDRQTIDGRTALSLAADIGCLDCVKDLLRRKASVFV